VLHLHTYLHASARISLNYR